MLAQRNLGYGNDCFRNLPRSTVIGVILVTVVYLLTNISYLAVLSTDELLNSSAVAVVSSMAQGKIQDNLIGVQMSNQNTTLT